ncbi:MAG: DUF362 domain-containing protein [Provencibacterium sp.]|nr:DUF362 domain-containing protein [Provencibacterium sp.]
MEKPKVFYTDLHVTYRENLLQKLDRLMQTAGIANLDFNNKFVAVKIHFGEPGNLAFLRPNWAKVVADRVKALGGRPFLTDCNTLYVGRRKNALDHLDAAYENGYTPFSTGCQIIIADGIKGTDEVNVPVNGDYVREAKIGRAIMDADILISLNHFKCHELTGFGGALKNIGMGCGSRAGKMEMHSAGKPVVLSERCIGCGACRKNCAHDAISFSDRKARIDHNRCVGCGRCIGVCPEDAVEAAQDEANDIACKKISEYTAAVLKDRPSFHINLVMDISPYCDCHAENDVPIVEDIGMYASFDPVALDVACADAVNALPPVPGSILSGRETGGDHFGAVHPTTDWRAGTAHAEKLGLGRQEYELVRI